MDVRGSKGSEGLQTICTITMSVRGLYMPMKFMKQNKG